MNRRIINRVLLTKKHIKMKPVEIIKLSIRLLLGGMFITSAILKLISIDEFELYIYSFNFFDFVTVTFLSRLLVAFEFLLGILLIFKVKYQYSWWLSMITIASFTLFLVYTAIFRNDTNCHCFGELVELNPLSSIFKNLLTIIFLLLIRGKEDSHFRFKKVIVGILIATSLLLPFIVNPMDALYNKIFSPEKEMNLTLFEELKQDTAINHFNVDHGNYLIAFYISGCKYCRLGMKKINSIVEKNEINIDKVKIMIAGSAERIENFKTDTESTKYNFYLIPPHTIINLVYGSFPTFALVENGKIKRVMNLRGLDERELVDFLK